jgi:hypothetical protein
MHVPLLRRIAKHFRQGLVRVRDARGLFFVAAGLLFLGFQAAVADSTSAPVSAAATPALAPVAAAASAAPATSQPVANFAPGPETYAKLKTSTGRTQFFESFCTGCHNAKLKTANLVLEGIDTHHFGDHADIWEKVVVRLGAGEMPPGPIKKRPDPQVTHAMVESLIADLDKAASKKPFVGRTVVRRLNRAEYGNAVRDLLHFDFPFVGDLPTDGVAHGFDNIADSLSMSPLLLESYLKVAHRVSELAIGEGDPSPVTERFPATKSQAVWQGEGMPFETRGGVLVKKYFPRDGEYDLRAFLNDADLTPTEGVRFFHIRQPVKAGQHTFIVTFPESSARSEGPIPNLPGAGGAAQGGPVDVKGSAIRPTLVMLLDGRKLKEFEIGGPEPGEAISTGVGPPTLARAEITGPYNPGPPADSESRRHILICTPQTAAAEPACAERILTTLLRHAWRHDVTREDVKPFLAAYTKARAKRNFASAISVGLRDILVSPAFLFRLEFDPKNVKPGQVYRVNDFDLASRLSFFLWSSIPDDELLAVAAKGQLHNPATLTKQVSRMLASEKSTAVMDNFGAQWLTLRGGEHDLEVFKPDAAAYPDFDVSLRDGFETEARLFLRSLLRENRSVMDVVNANYTFVNEKLAKNYGIPDVHGPGFRRVQLSPDSPRGGIIGMGAMLMPNSHTTGTSPIYRGKWILTNLLNSPPPPPPFVPALSEAPGADGKVLTTRELIERHRANPFCATCHARMDPYGFSLENFDVMGRWRAKDQGGPIDAKTVLVNGTTFTGPQGLRQILSSNPEIFVCATVARMMTYALGRPVDPHEMPVVRDIVRKTAPGYKFGDIVQAIVHSDPFTMRTVAGGQS